MKMQHYGNSNSKILEPPSLAPARGFRGMCGQLILHYGQAVAHPRHLDIEIGLCLERDEPGLHRPGRRLLQGGSLHGRDEFLVELKYLCECDREVIPADEV